MKCLVAFVVVMISGAAFAQGTDVSGCRLLSEANGTRVWQCAPTPTPDPGNTSGSEKK